MLGQQCHVFFLLLYSYLRVQQATSQPRCFPRLIYGGSGSGPGVMEWACGRNITWDVCYQLVLRRRQDGSPSSKWSHRVRRRRDDFGACIFVADSQKQGIRKWDEVLSKKTKVWWRELSSSDKEADDFLERRSAGSEQKYLILVKQKEKPYKKHYKTRRDGPRFIRDSFRWRIAKEAY